MKKPKYTPPEEDNELWVSPTHSLKGNRGERGWDHRITPPNSHRFLELADIALGLKKPLKKKAAAAAATHQTAKSEPYSQS